MAADSDRLDRIESVLAHLQHDLDSVNSSLLHQLRRLQEFDARLLRLESELVLQNEPVQRPDAALDRPPHY